MRPSGAKDKPATSLIGVRTEKRVLRDVKARALDGSAEDQRVLLQFIAATQPPSHPGVGLLSSVVWANTDTAH